MNKMNAQATTFAPYPAPTAEFRVITPEIAKKMLEANTRNRSIRSENLAKLVRDMEAGNFKCNGDGIRFDRNGVMLDGQHRLLALLQTGTTHQMLVVTGLAPEVMPTIDVGARKEAGDFLALEGYLNGKKIAATINVLAGLARGMEKRTLKTSEVFDVLAAHPGIVESYDAAKAIKLISPSYVAAFHYAGYCTGYGNRADQFVEVLRTGFAETPDDPAYQAREKFIRARASIRSIQRNEALEILAAAWELSRVGKTVKRLQLRKGSNRLSIHGWNDTVFWGKG